MGTSSSLTAEFSPSPSLVHVGRGGDIKDIKLRKEDFSNLQPFEKDFYVEHPSVAARSDEEVEQFRKQHQVHVQGTGVPKPVTTFEEASFPGVHCSVPVGLVTCPTWQYPLDCSAPEYFWVG